MKPNGDETRSADEPRQQSVLRRLIIPVGFVSTALIGIALLLTFGLPTGQRSVSPQDSDAETASPRPARQPANG